MMKRILGIVLVVLLAVTVLSCQKKEVATGDTTFTLLVDQDPPRPFDTEPGWYGLYDVIEKETGVKVDIMVYPYASAVERKGILLATNDYPDAMGGWIVSASDVMTYSADGVFIPLEDLIMTTKNVREALEYPGVRATMTLPDGHIYSPPYLVREPLVTYNPWINGTWLDQLGLKMPSTPAELKDVLIAFRDRIPNVNNQRIIPFTADANNKFLGMMAGWWGVNANGSASSGWITLINGRVEYSATRPEYREFIRYFADLNANRLLDPELFTQDLATWQNKGKLGIYGASIGYGPNDWIPEIDPRDKESDPSKNWGGWLPLPVLQANPAVKPVFRNNNFGNSIFRTQFVITDKASTAKAANIMKWLDAMYDPAHSRENVSGPQDKTWRIVSQSGVDVIWQSFDLSSWTQDERDKNGWGGWSIPSLPRYARRTWTEQPRPGWENEWKDSDVRDAVYEPFLEPVVIPAIWYSPDDQRRVADLAAPIASYVFQKMAEWITGQANVDAEWDAYIAQLDRMGLQEYLTIVRSYVKL